MVIQPLSNNEAFPPRLASVVDAASRRLEVTLGYASSLSARRHFNGIVSDYVDTLNHCRTFRKLIFCHCFFFKLRISGVGLESENEATCG